MTDRFQNRSTFNAPAALSGRSATIPTSRSERSARPAGRAINRVDTRGEIAGLAADARDAGGWLARFRLTRQANAERIRVVNEAVAIYFDKKRGEIELALSLDSDNNRKRLLAASMEETNIIQGEVMQLINDAQRLLQDAAMDADEASYAEEVRRIAELDSMLANGRITERRHVQAVAQVGEAIDERIERCQRTARRMLDNLDRRLGEALQDFEAPPRL